MILQGRAPEETHVEEATMAAAGTFPLCLPLAGTSGFTLRTWEAEAGSCAIEKDEIKTTAETHPLW